MSTVVLIEDLSPAQIAEGARSLLESGQGAARSGDFKMALILLSVATAFANEASDSTTAQEAQRTLGEVMSCELRKNMG